MNMQAMMQQAQKLQKEIANIKQEIEEKSYYISKEMFKIEASGKKRIKKIEINKKDLHEDDIEILGDMILLAINELFDSIDKELDQKMSKFGPGIKGII